MSELFNPPTRSQLDMVARGDVRLIKAFEQIFSVAGQDVYAIRIELDDVKVKADANEADIAAISTEVSTNTAGIAANSANISTNAADILSNASRIETNEVLLWLSV